MGGASQSEPATCPPRVAMACLISAEVSTLLAVMRRNVRWVSGVRYGDGGHSEDHNDLALIHSLKSLRGLAFSWDPLQFHSIDPAIYLRPFLDVIGTEQTAPIIGAALNSVHKFLALDMFDTGSTNIADSIGMVVNVVTTCKYEVIDPASEEAVLVKILQVLSGCVRSRAAPVLTNRHVCAVVETCFRVVQQAATKGELLQRVARQSMQEVIRCIFSRLPHLFSPEDEQSRSTQLENRAHESEPMQDTEKVMNEPFGVPCMVAIFEYLCYILNIAEGIESNPRVNPIDFDEDVPLFALGLIHSAIELSGSSIQNHPKLLSFVRDELFRNLMQFGLSMSPLILSTVCNIVLNLFYHLRAEVKLQLEAFFSCVVLRLAQSRYGPTYQQQEVALEALVDFCQQKEFMAEMYANMDCEIMCSNVFEEMINLLSKSAFPVNSPLSPLNVLALEGLVAVLRAMAERVESGGAHNPDRAADMEIEEYYPFWLDRCADCADTDRWVGFIRHRKCIKKKLLIGVDQFNRDTKKGFEYLQTMHLLPAELDAQSVALFFRYTPGLDKTLTGDYLGHHDEFWIRVLHEFARTFDFTGMRLDTALRLFLETFRLPGEAQKIQRVLEAFSERYYEQSPQVLANKDAALLLSYSLILLNTDQHNVKVKKKMTEEDFIRNNRRINGGEDLPREFLSELYDSICKNEIRTMPAEQAGAVAAGLLEMSLSRWLDLMAKAEKASPYIKCGGGRAPGPHLNREMFCIMAGPAAAAVSVVFDYTESEAMLGPCMDGFMSVARLAAAFHMDDALNDLIVALCKFTTLLSNGSIDDPVTVFGDDLKARMATEAVFTIANTYGDHIRGAWRSVIDCILSLYKLNILPVNRLNTTDESDASSASVSSDRLISKPVVASQIVSINTPKRSYGLMSRVTQLLYLDTEELKVEPTEEQVAARRQAVETVDRCQIYNIFTESKFLQADSLSHLAKALVQVAGPPPQKNAPSQDDEDTSVFLLELLIAVTLNNRDRIVLLWQDVYEHIARIIQSVYMPGTLVEKAVFGLLHICQRLLPYKENLADDLLKSLQLILKLDARVADAYCENITKEVARLLKANAGCVRSQAGWRTITSLLSITARHPDACEAGFDALVFVMSDGAHLSPANFMLCVEAARQFAESRLAPEGTSVHALELMAGSVNSLSRWSNELKDAGPEAAERLAEGIREMWLRLVIALRKVCTDSREDVRNHALISMQRCLVTVEGIFISGPAWLQCFEIAFQLLDELLEIAQSYSPKDYRNMEGSLLHVIKLLSKAFLQSLQDVSGLGDVFGEIWLGVLSRMDKYMKVRLRGRRMEKLQEAIPELLKNVLLVMKASGALSKNCGLWDATCPLVNGISPSLLLEVFPEPNDGERSEGTVLEQFSGAQPVPDGGIPAAV